MIDLEKAKQLFQKYINNFNNQKDPGFNLKVVHTSHVVENSMVIAKAIGLSQEEINLAGLIAILHDIGRFYELNKLKKFDSVNNDHALWASKILFEDGMIKDFVLDDKYNSIIQKAIENHNKKEIEEGLNEKEMIFAIILRDADKLDNFRVKLEEKISDIFPGIVNNIEDIENSQLSKKVYNSIINNECVDIKDRVYPLDYWVCILGFIYDINFNESLKIIENNSYINRLIDRFEYRNCSNEMNIIRNNLLDYVNKRLNDNQ